VSADGKRLAGLFSGGKDSSYALYLAVKYGYHPVVLLNLRPDYGESLLYHCVGGEVVPLQAKALGLSLEIIDIPSPEREVEALESALSRLEVDALACGAVASNFQKRVFGEACESIGIEMVNPMWGKNDPDTLREIVDSGFDVIVAAVGAEGLGEEWLGRLLDAAAVEELLESSSRFRFSPMGEGGEYETLVLGSPMMSGRIEVEFEVHWELNSGTIEVTSASLLNP